MHLNTYKSSIYKFLYLWIFPLSYLSSTDLTPYTHYSPFLWNFVKIIWDKTRDFWLLRGSPHHATFTVSEKWHFQYIFDCLGKQSIRSILVQWHQWTIFLRKWARSFLYGQWRALPCHAQRIFVSKNWRGWHGHLVLTGRDHLTHSQRHNRYFAHCFRKSNNQPNFWCELAASELWFDPVGLFFVRSREG